MPPMRDLGAPMRALGTRTQDCALTGVNNMRTMHKSRLHERAANTCSSSCMPSGALGFTRRPVRLETRSVTVRAAGTTPGKKNNLARLLANNKDWAAKQTKSDPGFFTRLKDQQAPEYLWIGCADSRVPANQIVGLDPGEVFVQRNVGNQAHHTDMNAQACIEFSVKALGVRTIVVCGHYKCGAVKAALGPPPRSLGVTNLWIQDIREARNQHLDELMTLSEDKQVEKLCEYNVLRQVFHVCTSPTVQEMWDQGVDLKVYGVCYGLDDGILQPLVGPISSNEKMGTTDQVQFEKRSMKERNKGVLESLLKNYFEPTDVKYKQSVQARRPKSPQEENSLRLSGMLAEHAAWDLGKY